LRGHFSEPFGYLFPKGLKPAMLVLTVQCGREFYRGTDADAYCARAESKRFRGEQCMSSSNSNRNEWTAQFLAKHNHAALEGANGSVERASPFGKNYGGKPVLLEALNGQLNMAVGIQWVTSDRDIG